MPKNTTDIDRKVASKMLGVSVRTVDRYIRRGTLAARQRDGRVWLDKEEIMHLSGGGRTVRRISIDRQPMSRLTIAPRTDDAGFYKDLYNETRRALGENQQKLDQAAYRIGQLESQIMRPQIQSPMPLPTRTYEYNENISRHDEQNLIHNREIRILKELVQKEKTNRIIFAVITYLLLALLPIVWLLLR